MKTITTKDVLDGIPLNVGDTITITKDKSFTVVNVNFRYNPFSKTMDVIITADWHWGAENGTMTGDLSQMVKWFDFQS